LNWRLAVKGIQCASSQAASVRTGLLARAGLAMALMAFSPDRGDKKGG
jgi:hypothetical protein